MGLRKGPCGLSWAGTRAGYPLVKKGKTEAETSKRATSYRPATTAALRRWRQQGPEFKVILCHGLLNSCLTASPMLPSWVCEFQKTWRSRKKRSCGGTHSPAPHTLRAMQCLSFTSWQWVVSHQGTSGCRVRSQRGSATFRWTQLTGRGGRPEPRPHQELRACSCSLGAVWPWDCC